jgi:hypothetical protein
MDRKPGGGSRRYSSLEGADNALIEERGSVKLLFNRSSPVSNLRVCFLGHIPKIGKGISYNIGKKSSFL